MITYGHLSGTQGELSGVIAEYLIDKYLQEVVYVDQDIREKNYIRN